MKKEKLLSKNIIVCLLALICCMLWGSAFPCVKIGYKMLGIAADNTASQILFAGYRFSLAGLLVIIAGSIAQKKILVPKVNEIPKVMALSAFQTIIQYLLFYIGLANTTGVKASVIIGSNVFIAVVVSSLIFHLERLSLNKAIGCVIGFAGIIIINLSGGGVDMNIRLTGEGFMFISTFSYAFSSVMMKKYSKSVNPVMMSGWQFLFGGIVMSLMGIISGGEVNIDSSPELSMLFYLAFISAVAYSLWAILLKYNPVSKVAVYGFMNPVIGVILSALLLNEGQQAFGFKGIISLFLVCIGIYVVNFRR